MTPADAASSGQDALAFLAGGGEMGERIRAFDWSRTPLGPVAGWPQSLRSALSICLNSSFPIAIYWGGDLLVLYNDEWSPILGEKHPWALGRPAREAWPEIWDIISPLFERVVTTGEATRSRDQLLPMHRHGYTEECYFDYTFSPVRGEGGTVDGVFNAVIETTSRVIGERRLHTLRDLAAWKTGEARSAEEACRTAAQVLAENPHDLPFALLYLLDGDGRRAHLAGLTGAVGGTLASPAVVDLDGEDSPWPFRQVTQTGKPVEVHHLPGRPGPLPGEAWPGPPERAVVLPMARPGQAQLAGFVVAGVSPRLALHDEYRGFLDLLAGHVAAAVANARAYEEERRRAEALAELDRAKTAFFSNVSHELRTPLTLLLGPVEDMLAQPEGALPPDSRGLLSLVHRNALRLQKLVNTLLDFSRIEAGRVQAIYEPTDLSALTADLASSFRSACDRAGLQLVVNCPPLPELVHVDHDMWEKVVLNLLSNAFKFTFQGEIAVSLRQVGRHVELAVRDTGAGIPADQMPRLFERFQRVEGTRGRTQEGSGIGLALVRELVRLHGGEIHAVSAVPGGSTFTVAIPLGTAHLSPDRIGGPRTAAPTAPGAAAYVEEALRWLPDAALVPTGAEAGGTGRPRPATGPRPRILLADDNADMREYVRRLLADRYDVTAVADGVAARDAARAAPPDLVLTDVMMPGLDGFALLRELRADDRTRGLPVLLLSARAGEEARVEGLRAGADDYLTKPFSARELLARVDAHLSLAQLRRESAAAVRASEQRFQAFMEHSPATAYIKDAQGRYVFVNRALERAFGRPLSDWVGRTDFDLFPAEEAEQLRQNDQSVLASGATARFEEVTTQPEGPHHYLSFKFPLQDGDGGWLVGGMSIDITEQKQAEERELLLLVEAATANAQFRAFFEQGALFAGIMQVDGTFVEPNRACLEACGYTREQVVGRPFWECPWWNRSPAVMARIQKASAQAAAGEAFRAEMPYFVADGSERVVDLIILPIKDEQGRVQFLAPTGTDITDRKRAEQQLAEAHEFLHSSLDALSSHIAVLDETGVILAVNDAWRRFGEQNQYGGDSYGVGTNYIETCELSADGCIEGGTVAAGLKDVLGGRTPSFELEYPCHAPTEERWFVMRATRFRSPGPVRVVVAHENVTKRKLAEDALKEADRRKDDFLALLAHELRNPLAPLRNGLQILRLAEGNRTAAAQARTMMERQLTQLVRIVDDLLDVSRITRNKLELRRERVGLADVIQSAVETSRPLVEERGHDLVVELPPGPVPLDADPTRLAQVFANLLNNSVKYTPPGGCIRLTAARHAGGVAVSVQDDGIGIPAAFLDGIFDMFSQVDRTLEKSTGGLGIGLSLVKGLVEMHGGTIEAHSAGEGKGSTFTVRLPVAEEAPRPGPPQAHENGRTAPAGLRVLVVDDNQDSAESLALLLRLGGNDVRTAHDGLEAVEAAEAHRPELILMDVGMPRLNGLDATRRIRQQPWGKGIVIVALTGWGQEGDRSRTAEAGCDGHLVKPVDPDALEGLLRSLADR